MISNSAPDHNAMPSSGLLLDETLRKNVFTSVTFDEYMFILIVKIVVGKI